MKLAISRDFYPTHKNIDPGTTRTRITHESAFDIDRRYILNEYSERIHVPEKETTHTHFQIIIYHTNVNTIMLHKINVSKLIQNQIKSFSFIVFVITFALIFLNSSYNIIPLNIITFIGSLYLFHYKPGYYDIVNSRDPKLTPFLALVDFILHYIPLIVIIMLKVFNKTESNYTLCFTILASYILLFHAEISDIYFNYNQYFSRTHNFQSIHSERFQAQKH